MVVPNHTEHPYRERQPSAAADNHEQGEPDPISSAQCVLLPRWYADEPLSGPVWGDSGSLRSAGYYDASSKGSAAVSASGASSGACSASFFTRRMARGFASAFGLRAGLGSALASAFAVALAL